ncbi:iron ABC transporter substrate-binding protein [Puteibacter caeruleilacunae]|nr:iron ABC transporter substrate-binding protein [Puteibacter caeruleilacunae]
MIKIFIYSFLVCLFVASCGNPSKSGQKNVTQNMSSQQKSDVGSLRYAKGFLVEEYEKYRLLKVLDPNDFKTVKYQFALVQKDEGKVNTPEGIPVIEVPIRSLVCMTSTQVSYIIRLGLTDRLVGVASSRFLFDENIQKGITDGRVERIGIEGSFKVERLMDKNPDLVMVSPFKKGGYNAIKDLGLTLVPNIGYKENHPLARAEWLKFTALFFGMEQKADSIFNDIERNYLDLKAKADQVKSRPTIFSGECKSGIWYAVGGKSYLATIFKDAGAHYFMEDNDQSGGVNLDFETVYNQAENSDYWRLLVSHQGDFSYNALLSNDERYADFKAFQNRAVISCNLRQKPFYERTPVEPHIVLADFIKAMHPDILPEYEPVYYELLKDE